MIIIKINVAREAIIFSLFWITGRPDIFEEDLASVVSIFTP
jgi:hypothetical protein